MYSTVEKIDDNTYLIRVAIPPAGESFKAPVVGDHFIAEDGHFEITSVEETQDNAMAFRVTGQEID